MQVAAAFPAVLLEEDGARGRGVPLAVHRHISMNEDDLKFATPEMQF